ncbi:MAG: beta-ketoacyl synthase, partial [Muribaculaceae bacterium]|nr:beta-ketoacyl synthase [Muribaculaceae bacterium]
ILSKADNTTPGVWYIEAGAMHNDANHISGPSRVGEGSYRCLRAVTKDIDINDIAVINTHGTATLYNDEMESIALDRAGLASVKVNAYKGYLGHTLGAAGVLECILSMLGIDNGIVLKTLGYESTGVSRLLNIVTENTATDRCMFVKMLSGFGGSNAAVRLRKEGWK